MIQIIRQNKAHIKMCLAEERFGAAVAAVSIYRLRNISEQRDGKTPLLG